MSRIGKKPIILESGVTMTTQDGGIQVSGPKGTLTVSVPSHISVTVQEQKATVQSSQKKNADALVGLFRSLIHNAVVGVTKGWTKSLELIGVGYRAQADSTTLTLNLGFAHPVIFKAPTGINFSVAEQKVTVAGIDKYAVGEMAAMIRRVKPPEPYKGKGIRYVGEVVRKKVGKAGKAVGGTGGK